MRSNFKDVCYCAKKTLIGMVVYPVIFGTPACTIDFLSSAEQLIRGNEPKPFSYYNQEISPFPLTYTSYVVPISSVAGGIAGLSFASYRVCSVRKRYRRRESKLED